MQLPLLLTCGLIMLFATSLLVGMCRVGAARSRRLAEFRQALATVREYEFIPVHAGQLAEGTRQQFDRHTPAMLKLGLLPLADYRMKPPPVEVHNRFFLSPDGEILGDITALLEKGGVSFISVLADGICVHTTSSKNPRPDRTLGPADRIVLTYAGIDDASELYRIHQAILNETAKSRGTAPLRFSADQLRPLMVYDQRLFNRWRFRHGDFATEPPAPDFATLEGQL